ncbi:MAG TPA: glucosaminidase [Firmicutes bacterium]|nr:glucosaminidase [Candidatus Fermentithermobacillaceae bacterium]
MGCIKILVPGGAELPGHLIEGRSYARVRDVAESLGFGVDWDPSGLVVISERPRSVEADTDLRLPSAATPALLDAYLAGSHLETLGAELVAAEERWRVNAIFACAVACHESDFGRSAIAREKRNLFGIMAFDSDPYRSARTYSSYRESIDDFCRLISREYLNPAGAFYDAPTVTGVGKRYATDPEWSTKVLIHCRRILAKAGEEPAS